MYISPIDDKMTLALCSLSMSIYLSTLRYTSEIKIDLVFCPSPHLRGGTNILIESKVRSPESSQTPHYPALNSTSQKSSLVIYK